jgi:hypothetical protein
MKITTYPNWCDMAKAVVRRKFLEISAHIKKRDFK